MHISSRIRQEVRTALLGAFVIAANVTTVFGKSSDPVVIAQPVAVEGVVQVLNDTLYTPYVVTVSTPEATETPRVDFDIPDGKRLIIETIAFQASLPAGESSRMFLEPVINGERKLIPLLIQDRVNAGGYYLVSNVPFKIRIDSAEGSTTEVRIRRGTGGAGTLGATICGYLVDK